MSTDDSKPGGLFSKVVRFVRHPTLHWSELDAQADDPLGQADREVLRQTLERKRRNDFVRQREFEQLRRLRQKEAAASETPGDASSQPASLQSSQTPSDARAVTLKKIDAIEEQMSQQWWRNKQPADASTLPMYLLSSFPQPDSVHVAGATAAAASEASATPGFAVTAPLDWDVGAAAAPEPPLAQAVPAPEPPTFATTIPLDPPAWSAPAQPWPVASGPFVHDPDFEAAAIAFANGAATGAEAMLLDLLVQRTAQPEAQMPVWHALFDLYRAAGMGARFEDLAIDYAARFGRSAPLWFALSPQHAWTIPGAAVLSAAAAPGAAAPGAGAPDIGMRWEDAPALDLQAPPLRWTAPAVLTRASVAALEQAKAAAPAPWTLFWGGLECIEADAVAALEQVFTEWAQTPGPLFFLDAPVLAQCLQALTVSGDRAVPEDGWRLRMAALRLMDQPDSFELVALDYCVTYEVSPPSWAPPRSNYRDALVDDAAEAPGTAQAPGAGLAGCIDGDATPALAALEAQVLPGQVLVVDCAELLRLDFAAAGSVLNWAARLQSEGVALRFERLHQLVAVFLAMVGVGEHAQLVPRRD
ncbi:STAS domain-containing protein [Comamonas antarctica]|uniref:STAS domain-containing protein n=1 Tax=Comamonas antarctica TaxID=2743470 RepID=UPI0028E925BC|nr:STAS domain-containing protein [Comamonas antarctica]